MTWIDLVSVVIVLFPFLVHFFKNTQLLGIIGTISCYEVPHSFYCQFILVGVLEGTHFAQPAPGFGLRCHEMNESLFIQKLNSVDQHVESAHQLSIVSVFLDHILVVLGLKLLAVELVHGFLEIDFCILTFTRLYHVIECPVLGGNLRLLV